MWNTAVRGQLSEPHQAEDAKTVPAAPKTQESGAIKHPQGALKCAVRLENVCCSKVCSVNH